MTRANEPAFPCNSGLLGGMTLREYYAGQVLIGLITSPRVSNYTLRGTFRTASYKELSETCCEIADALIAQLNAPEKSTGTETN